jgi:pimeloyl-ACP methyl ester carboxylesterase
MSAAAGDPITETRRTFAEIRTHGLEVSGEGPTLLLLHGYSDRAESWRGVLAALRARNRSAVAIDLPGFGRADPRGPGLLLPQFDRFADDLVQAYSGGGRRPVLVGNSLGALIALRAAARHDLTAVVAIDQPALARARFVRRIARSSWPTPLPTVIRASSVSRRVVRPAAMLAGRWSLYGQRRSVGAAHAEAILDYFFSTHTPRYAVREIRSLAFEILENPYTLERITCPTLVLHGGRDRVIPARASHALHAGLPGSELIIFPRLGHCPHVEEPAVVTGRILEFLDRRGAAAATSTGS